MRQSAQGNENTFNIQEEVSAANHSEIASYLNNKRPSNSQRGQSDLRNEINT